MKKLIRNLLCFFGIHFYTRVVHKNTTLIETWRGYTIRQNLPGLATLEICTNKECLRPRSYLTDSTGDRYYKNPEVEYGVENVKIYQEKVRNG